MREQGFAGLRTGAIARLVGKDKNLVRYHFSGLAGLQKAYIREKDYWPPFFERFSVGADSSAFELEQLFSELMAENLRFFYGDTEMQKIILWQISEKNALMRSISDAREADGAKLLDLTDRFFSGTDVNFRAVIALLLGGVYYMVLHANGNGSVVCGIDVHSERDRADVLRTIGQIVSWTFRQVDDGLGFSDGGAVGFDRFSVLENLASRFGIFVSGGRTDTAYLESLDLEVERLRFSIEERLLELADPVQLSSFVRVSLFRLGRLADRFYVEGEEVHPEAALVVSLLEVFLAGFRDLVAADWVLPKLLWEREFARLSARSRLLDRVLAGLNVNVLLSKAVLAPLLEFFGGKGLMIFGGLSRLQVYFDRVLEVLEGREPSEEELFYRLVGLGESGACLLDYFKERVAVRSLGLSGVEVKKMLLLERSRISAIAVFGDGKVKALLLGWLDQQLLGFSAGEVGAENPLKFSSGLKVVELSYLLKLLFDQGVFGSVKLDVFTAQVGANFLSVSGGDISAGSVKSKLYPKDGAVVKVVEKILVSMLEDLRSGR